MDNSHNKNIPAGESRTELEKGEEKEEKVKHSGDYFTAKSWQTTETNL